MKWIAKPFLWIFTSAIPVFIAACYGAYYEESRDGDDRETKPLNFDVSGWVVDSVTAQGIADIRVSCITEFEGDGGVVGDQTYSMEGDGAFTIRSSESAPCEALRFEDVDGDENGRYADKELPLPLSSHEDETVELTPKR